MTSAVCECLACDGGCAKCGYGRDLTCGDREESRSILGHQDREIEGVKQPMKVSWEGLRWGEETGIQLP